MSPPSLTKAESISQAWSRLPESEKELKAFTLFDKDRDGQLSKEELVNILVNESGGSAMTEREAVQAASRLLARFDQDKDGMLSYDEFVVWWDARRRLAEQEASVSDAKPKMAAQVAATALPRKLSRKLSRRDHVPARGSCRGGGKRLGKTRETD